MKSLKIEVYKKLQKVKLKKEFSRLFEKYSEYTMIPQGLYFANLNLAYHYRNVPGSIVECGVWKGGMIAGMTELIATKKAYLFDSYEGLPDAREIDGQDALNWQKDVEGSYYFDNCMADEKFAIEAMQKSGCEFESSKGWFEETLIQTAHLEEISILRLDADWYDSTLCCLRELYPKVARGGIIIIDDYYTWDGCSRAVHRYLNEIGSMSRVNSESGIAYIKKQD
ncbi:TylF/MycF/NovP-related O-methyltransferase [Algoriphagus sediminis]|uniref:TylF/MycF/NovP-related O-methyltransferase n=1 Tax=Algoriphagus sediminis TaxID=3057113 RepID=A0ABT7YDV2_9BACT|nr:TylF/MycF/NovP-related O-methyltransferase [Algoriphagus sediminis]MDN3204700.1 TylF/MycF/NovP-related O-methyltransferase [Algoriphagus sediminis]